MRTFDLGRLRSRRPRFALALGLILLAAASATAVGIHLRPALEWIAARRAFAADHPVPAICAYVAAYVTFAALAIPGVWTLSVVAGAMFGFWLGLPLALASNAAGATAAMLISRHLLRAAIAARYPEAVAKIDARVARHGAAWVVAARLTPIVPYFAVNVGVGLTRMRAPLFALVSLAGSAPLAVVYVLAGANLATSATAADILTPSRLALLVGLAAAILALPPLARRLRAVAP